MGLPKYDSYKLQAPPLARECGDCGHALERDPGSGEYRCPNCEEEEMSEWETRLDGHHVRKISEACTLDMWPYNLETGDGCVWIMGTWIEISDSVDYTPDPPYDAALDAAIEQVENVLQALKAEQRKPQVSFPADIHPIEAQETSP